MKTLLCFLGTFVLTLSASGQELLPIKKDNSCSYYGEDIADDVYGFASSNEAEDAVSEIVDAVGLQKNFVIKAGNVPNAVATMQNGKRLIIYSEDFMVKLKQKTGSKWAAYGILAHEIGHHLNAHTLEDGGSKPPLELAADQFSGFILGKMGATLDQAQSAINAKASARGSSTHPPRSARLEAVAVGWNKAKEQMGDPGSAMQPGTSPRIEPKDSKPETEPDVKELQELIEAYSKDDNSGTPTSPTRSGSTTTITIGYSGDQYGCYLPVNINIGGAYFAPQGNRYMVSNIPVGQQQYVIQGTINCGVYGSCTAYGEGTLYVQPGATYWIVWQNTSVGYCSIGLQSGN
jgi:hypothetical protein